jgi:hypothetical protein
VKKHQAFLFTLHLDSSDCKTLFSLEQALSLSWLAVPTNKGIHLGHVLSMVKLVTGEHGD